ncbi:type II toxin-antitoxin system VapC family toxin [Ruania halotolerans]|uniref:type II toxin-antitoxin system VapC family toxin n=1 Tax=Ruania halotolerans TaxID=2897773 RepID=UPI001E43918B|nr:type II toxin-antitoxin system VapC family toxin [Ruania halotolerans]UFU05554.1 type II toxin-antitoxin system VapC family toxin [Ruania halotolerans]
MIVPDASVVALLLHGDLADARTRDAVAILRSDPAWIVPEHWCTEVLSVIRGLWLGGKVSDADADQAVTDLAGVTVAVVPTAPHVSRIWRLRSNLSVYDAGYVAIAEAHDVTLVTADARIARSGVARCPVQVVQ